jgi:hypothetical protein
VTRDDRGVVADWFVLLSAGALFISLFLTWSHLSPAYLALADQLHALQGVTPDPTAWQVYTAADVVLAVLAVALVAAALMGKRRLQICAIVAAFLALGFVIHALNVPPTNGAADAFRPSLDVPQYVAPAPQPGPGEVVAIGALVLALAGLGVSLRNH